MESTRVHHATASRLTVSYQHQGKQRQRCFRVMPDGELGPVECKPGGVGVGTAIKAATESVGIRPCGGCLRRAEALDRATPPFLRRWIAALFRRR